MKFDLTGWQVVCAIMLIVIGGLATMVWLAPDPTAAAVEPVPEKLVREPVYRVPTCQDCGYPMRCPNCSAAEFAPQL